MNEVEKRYAKLINDDLNEGYSAFNYHHFYDWISRFDRYKVYVEVGCWKGFSISYLAGRLLSRHNVRIYAVDLWRKTDEMLFRWDDSNTKHDAVKSFTPLYKRFSLDIPPDKLIYDIYNTNLERNGVRDMISDIRMKSSEGADKFDDCSVDFVFLDADHSYESVIKDIECWKPKVRKGGIIAGHDYSMSGVQKAVNEIFKTPKRYDGDVWSFFL